MAQKTVRWFSCIQLPCKTAPGNEVFLYVDSSLVVQPSYHFVEATVEQVINTRFKNCTYAYCYFFHYDDEDTTRELVTEDIIEAFCKNSLTQFIQDTAGLGGGGESEGGTLSDAVWLPMVQVPFGDIGPAFAEVSLDSHNKRYLTIENNTDVRIIVSFDNSTDHGTVRSNGSWTIPLAANGAFENSPVSIKHEGTDATEGDVIISAFY